MAEPTKRPDYRERQAQKKRSATLKVYLAALVLGGLCGLAFYKRAEIKTLYDQWAAPVSVKEVPPVVVVPPPAAVPLSERKTTPPVAPVAPTVVVPPKSINAVPEVSPRDQARARQLIAQGKNAIDAFDFRTATAPLNEAAALNAGEALRNEAQTWSAKAREFANATRHIPVADFAQAEQAVVIETVDGSEWQGVKVGEDDERVRLQAVLSGNPAGEGKQLIPIPKNEIRKISPLPLATRQAQFAQLLLAAEGGLRISDSTDLYDLVFLSKRLGMNKECLAYLNRAFDGGQGHPADPHVGDSFRQVVIRRAIGRASLLMAANRVTQTELELKKLKQTLPGYDAADQEIAAFRSQVMDKVKPGFKPSVSIAENRPSVAPQKNDKKKLASEDTIEVSVDNSGVTGAGPAAAIVEKGNRKFSEAMNIVNKYKLGVGGNKDENNRVLMEAKKLFMEAIDTYEEALKLEPANRAVQSRQQTASTMVYFCIKNFIFG